MNAKQIEQIYVEVEAAIRRQIKNSLDEDNSTYWEVWIDRNGEVSTRQQFGYSYPNDTNNYLVNITHGDGCSYTNNDAYHYDEEKDCWIVDGEEISDDELKDEITDQVWEEYDTERNEGEKSEWEQEKMQIAKFLDGKLRYVGAMEWEEID